MATMSKKKKNKRLAQKTKPKSEMSPPMMDRRAMEKSLRDIGKLLSERNFESVEEANAFLKKVVASGGPAPAPCDTPLEQAQDLVYQTWDSSGKRRVQLARQALEVSEDCADAYVLLAEEAAASLEEALNFYEQGMKAAERALGSRAFQEDAGHFWGILETRPYMRARLGLAQCQWALGERQQAIRHYTEMLRLNPNDNQGVRDLLVNCLLEDGSDEMVGKLLDQYEEDASATWLYSRALWAFRRTGTRAEKQLRAALDGNPHVPAYLLGRKPLPRILPEYVGFGDETEAIAYAAEALDLWHNTPGALQWLDKQV